MDGPGFFWEHRTTCFDEMEPYRNQVDASLCTGVGTSLMWEFDSRDIKPFHWFIGLESGVKFIGLEFAGNAGFSYQLTDLNKLRLELMGSTSFGILWDFWGYCYYYGDVSCDVVLCGASRKGLYGGIGVAIDCIPDIQYYKQFGVELYMLSSASIHIAAGYRF